MEATKHTPGPWQIYSSPTQICITANNNKESVAQIPEKHPNAIVNAKLISEAPEMLDALEDMINLAERSMDILTGKEAEKAEKTINKAKEIMRRVAQFNW
jgi:hypothetical protein